MKKILFIILAVTIFEGCGAVETSSPYQLTEKIYKCHDFSTAEEDAFLADMPAKLISTQFTGTDLERVRNFFTSVPKDHMDFFYEAYNEVGFRIVKEGMGSGVVGLTRFGEDYPYNLAIGYGKGDTNYAFGHELGHAYDVYLRKTFTKGKIPGVETSFSRSINDAYQGEGLTNGPQKANGLSPLRQYAMSSVKEYFAEAYQNYYCGPEANQYFKAKLPSTYELFGKVMKAPRWMTASLGGQTIHIGLADAGGSSNYLKFAVPKESVTIRVCNTKDAASCQNGNSMPMVVDTQVNGNYKFFRTQNPVLMIPGATMPLVIQGFLPTNTSGTPDSQRILELYQ